MVREFREINEIKEFEPDEPRRKEGCGVGFGLGRPTQTGPVEPAVSDPDQPKSKPLNPELPKPLPKR